MIEMGYEYSMTAFGFLAAAMIDTIGDHYNNWSSHLGFQFPNTLDIRALYSPLERPSKAISRAFTFQMKPNNNQAIALEPG